LANSGFAAGIVIALPAGVALADRGLWRPSFVTLAGFSLAAAGLLALVFPESKPGGLPRMAGAAGLLRAPFFLLHLALSAAVFTAMFAAYTYISVWLAEIAGFDNRAIALALAGFGVAGAAGNTAAAWIADRAPLRATVLAALVLTLAAAGLSLIAAPAISIALFAAWGFAHTACVALCQVRVALAGRHEPAFAMAMNISAANLGITLGALAGGWAVERWGVIAIGWRSLAILPLVMGLAGTVALLWREARVRG
jgi:predicted MFS family arabinose efflux permease